MRKERRKTTTKRISNQLWSALFFLLPVIALWLLLPSVQVQAAVEPEAPVFSVEPGFYEDPFYLELTHTGDGNIYYTTDGSLPVPGAADTRLYSDAIALKDVRVGSKAVMQGTVIRAIAQSADGTVSECATATYFVGTGVTTTYKVPVFSLVTDPANLYDADTGIFVHYEERGRDWERPFHVEYFTSDQEMTMSINCGARVHGGASRSNDMKSLRLYARKEYDSQKTFVGDFFSDGLVEAVDASGETIDEFKHLLLRGGGNEASAWERTYFRDTLSAWIMKDTGLDVQASAPAVVFLNGRYYGIMNLRERQDEHYINEHYALPEDEIAIMEFWYDAAGEIRVVTDASTPELAAQAEVYFNEAYQFASTADLTIPENYEKICSYFDIENYINYLCIEIYSNNTDWPGNNCKAWCYLGTPGTTTGSDGKIRWMLFDTEFGYGLYGHDATNNSLAAALSSTSVSWPNQKGSTLLFRSLLTNDTFRTSFVTRMLDLMNEPLLSKNLSPVITRMASSYAGLIREHKAAGNSYDSYDNNIEIVRTFLKNRPSNMYKHLEAQFDLGTRYQLQVDFDSSMGSLIVNSLSLDETSASVNQDGFRGFYYEACPVTVTAIANEGYQFTGFTGAVDSMEASIVLQKEDGTDTLVLSAAFEKLSEPSITSVPTGTDAEDTKDAETAPEAGETQSSKVPVILLLSLAVLLVLVLLVVLIRRYLHGKGFFS